MFFDTEPDDTQPMPPQTPGGTDADLDEAMKEVSKNPEEVLKGIGGKEAA